MTGTYRSNMPVPAQPGAVVNVQVSQQVGPDKADRFTVLLHAPQTRSGSETVNVYRAAVSLLTECMIRNAKSLGSLLSAPGLRSPALSSLRPQLAYCCTLPVPVVDVARCPGDKAAVRPSLVQLECDGSADLEHLKWSAWGFKDALATGVYREDNCVPSCAAGTFHSYPVQFHLSQPLYIPTSSPTGWAWEHAVITFTGARPRGIGRSIVDSAFAPGP